MRRLPRILLVVVVAITAATAAAAPSARLGGGELFIVRSGSMAPAIPVGAVMVTERVDVAALAVGDVVTVRLDSGAHLTHRVSRTIERDDGRWLELKGDANAQPDPNLVPGDAVVGRVHAVVPIIGYALAFLASPSGRLTALSLGLFLLLLDRLVSPVSKRAQRPTSGRRRGITPAVTVLVIIVTLSTGVAMTTALLTATTSIDATVSTGTW